MSEDYPKNLLELEKRFADEESCAGYLAALRWPRSFVCPECGGKEASITARGLWFCLQCQRHVSVTAGTVFHRSHLPLSLWFRAMWHITSQKNGVSALGLQRVLGLGSYRTAWAMLHKLRRAMVRPGRERLNGTVEVDETYYGGEQRGIRGRESGNKAIVAVAVEVKRTEIGRIRMHTIADFSRTSLHGFITEAIDPGSRVITDGYQSYRNLKGYEHDRRVPRKTHDPNEPAMPKVHRVVSLWKRWMLGTHQGAIKHEHLDAYLNEFTFRFNRRTSASRGKLFFRLAQQAVQVEPFPYRQIINHNM